MNEVRLSVPQVSCNCCVGNVSKAVEQVDGVAKVEVDTERKTVLVRYDDQAADEQRIRQAIEAAGYEVAA